MKMNTMLFRLIPLALALGACAGGGETGTGNNPGNEKIHTGVITGFGSVFLKGVEFDTSGTTYTLDGTSGAESQLAVGMVITLRGSVNADGKTGTASTIEYEDELEGIVLQDNIASGANTGTLNVMGRTVNVDANTLLKNLTSADAIGVGNVVEISGYASGGGDIFATRIELKRDSHAFGEEIEVKGVVQNVGATSFQIGTLEVSYDQAGTLSNGWYVKVKSTQGLNGGGALIASQVEKLADSGTRTVEADEGDEWEGEGVVTAALSSNTFQMNGIVIKVSSSTQYNNGSSSGLTVGTAVEVDGIVDASGAVVADEVEFPETADLEFEGNVEIVNSSGGTFTLFGQAFVVTNSTVMKDERDELQSFNLSNLVAGNRIRVRAYLSGTTLIATQLERGDDSLDPAELSGALDVTNLQYSVGGIPVNFVPCVCTPPAAGTRVELTGTWSGSAFNVTSFESE